MYPSEKTGGMQTPNDMLMEVFVGLASWRPSFTSALKMCQGQESSKVYLLCTAFMIMARRDST